MHRFVKPLAALGLALAVAAAPAQAQTRKLDVPATAGWKHAATGFVLPARLAGYPRTMLVDGSNSEVDVVAGFAAPDDSTSITVYLFRPALMSVPVWFDRSETQILIRDIYGSAQPVAASRPFAPPRASAASGLRRIYAPSKGPYKSTGLAMMPMGDWLVAIRISSVEFAPAVLDTKLDEIVGALGWPAGVAEAPAAAPVEACATPLAYARRAKLKKPSMEDALSGAIMSDVISKAVAKQPELQAKPVTYCRDQAPKAEYGVYRDAGEPGANAYVMALGDAGRVIRVAPNTVALELGRKGYALSYSDLEGTSIYPNFDKLASPEQALEAVRTTAPMSRASLKPDGGSNITISTGN